MDGDVVGGIRAEGWVYPSWLKKKRKEKKNMVLGMVRTDCGVPCMFCLAKKVRVVERIANNFCYPPLKIGIEPP